MICFCTRTTWNWKLVRRYARRRWGYILCFSAAFFFFRSSQQLHAESKGNEEKKANFFFFIQTSCTISWRLITQRIHVARFWKAFHISYNYSFATHILNIHNIHDCFLCLCFNSQLAFRRSCTSALCLLSCKEFISHSHSIWVIFLLQNKISLTYFLWK